jgi:hypothetical protein
MISVATCDQDAGTSTSFAKNALEPSKLRISEVRFTYFISLVADFLAELFLVNRLLIEVMYLSLKGLLLEIIQG